MALDIEGILDGGVGGEKPLGRTLRFKPLLFSLTAPDRQMRILGTIVFSQPAGAVTIGTAELARRGAIGRQAVSDDCLRMDALALQRFRRNLNAFRLFRRFCTSISRTSPSSSTARQRYILWPVILTTISPRCQRLVGPGLAFRRFRSPSGGPSPRWSWLRSHPSPRSGSTGRKASRFVQ